MNKEFEDFFEDDDVIGCGCDYEDFEDLYDEFDLCGDAEEYCQ